MTQQRTDRNQTQSWESMEEQDDMLAHDDLRQLHLYTGMKLTQADLYIKESIAIYRDDDGLLTVVVVDNTAKLQMSIISRGRRWKRVYSTHIQITGATWVTDALEFVLEHNGYRWPTDSILDGGKPHPIFSCPLDLLVAVLNYYINWIRRMVAWREDLQPSPDDVWSSSEDSWDSQTLHSSSNTETRIPEATSLLDGEGDTPMPDVQPLTLADYQTYNDEDDEDNVTAISSDNGDVAIPNIYSALGVGPSANHSEITTAFVAKYFGPDWNMRPYWLDVYGVLSDPEKRAMYDEALRRVTEVMRETGLREEFAVECLQAVGWDVEAGREWFEELNGRGMLPESVFAS